MVNIHAEAANVRLYNYNPREEGYRVSQAMLALAYEQRTANLIAWRNGGKLAVADIEEVNSLIRGRLELGNANRS